ncbi:MAG: hypothetical protein QOG63_105 [Thermoleophilaceae bacterium]|jgi:rubrerythrin|nr:hypothetical protein [Thermoleophilaceae bacterium]
MSRRLHSPELAAIEVDGMTRSAFLLRGTLAAGALYGAGAVAPFVSSALAQTTSGDVNILNFAYGLEQLESAFYKAALANAKLQGKMKALATEFGKHEDEHVSILEQTIRELGSSPQKAPKLTFGLTDQASFLRTAIQLEDLGVGAYNGAAAQLTSKDLLNAAAGIVQTEARHAAALRFRAGQPPAPAAFDPGLSTAQVVAAVRKYTGG